ncbi:MAG: Hsp33 family molecular chaperone HslO [Archangiaceae bacterium]|nr:Hsp33 family molecular chaperone HslO [Archangiaceae bacterium]
MSGDSLIRGVLSGPNLKWVACVTPALVIEAARLHGLQPGSAAMLGEGLNAAVLLAALQKGSTRVNLQIECDGPLRGLFVDASADGALRGYVKVPNLEDAAGALGRGGFLSVLRDLGQGEHYRSSVDLQAMDLSTDLERYFAASDQVPTRVALAPTGGVLLQCLPGADPAELERVGQKLGERLAAALPQGSGPLVAQKVFGEEPFEVLASYPLAWKCSCSKERVIRALTTMGPEELTDMIEKDGKASAKCQFCGRAYEISADELKTLLPSA